MKDSKYQKDIYKKIQNSNHSILITAVAGSGKTHTIVNSLKYTPKGCDKVFLAFNNTIVEELKKKIKDKEIIISTMHSICWRALLKHNNFKAKLEKNKSNTHIKKFLKKFKIAEKRHGFVTYNCSKLLDLVRQNMIDVNEIEDVYNLANSHDLEFDEEIYKVLQSSLDSMNRDFKVFDFTDMIYRCVIDNVRLPQFDFVYVDEGQDLSKVQHKIIKSLIKKRGGRLIAVGDPKQAIYGFAGADSDSYDNLRTLVENTIELPLNVNYRCGKEIIKYAKELNPSIEAFDGQIDGEVSNSTISQVKSGDWILCRNLKPLVIVNLHLTLRGIKSFIKGRDIGSGLETYIKKMNCKTLNSLIKKCELEILSECSKLKRKGVKNPLKTEKVDKMSQRYDMIRVLSRNCNSIQDLIQHIRFVFKDEGDGVCLSTIHKSKGLENDVVFFLCPELIPSRYAVMEWQKIQEMNLLYVAITRAKKRFHTITDYEKIEKEITKRLKDER